MVNNANKLLNIADLLFTFMGVATLFTAVSLVTELGLLVDLGVVFEVGVVNGVTDFCSFLSDLGVDVGVATVLGVELFSFPILLPKRGVLGVNLICSHKENR